MRLDCFDSVGVDVTLGTTVAPNSAVYGVGFIHVEVDESGRGKYCRSFGEERRDIHLEDAVALILVRGCD